MECIRTSALCGRLTDALADCQSRIRSTLFSDFTVFTLFSYSGYRFFTVSCDWWIGWKTGKPLNLWFFFRIRGDRTSLDTGPLVAFCPEGESCGGRGVVRERWEGGGKSEAVDLGFVSQTPHPHIVWGAGLQSKKCCFGGGGWGGEGQSRPGAAPSIPPTVGPPASSSSPQPSASWASPPSPTTKGRRDLSRSLLFRKSDPDSTVTSFSFSVCKIWHR